MSIIVKDLTKIYDQQVAVNNISFEIQKGEIVGFLGPNGAGKSTSMKMITGFLSLTSGQIKVCGFDVTTHPLEVKKRVGYLPEANPLYFDMYVREYLGFSANIHGLGKNKQAKIDEMIQRTGLTKEAHKKIGMLSKGYKQRVGLAQAMLHDPEVLILDEPTSGLDPNQLVEIRDLIIDIGKEKTVLLSTHIMQEVQAMCSRVIIINSGNIVADDPIERLQNFQNEKAVILGADAPINQQLFKQLKLIKKVESINNNTYRLVTDKPEELRKELLQWAINNDVNIAQLSMSTKSLEEIFRDLTQ